MKKFNLLAGLMVAGTLMAAPAAFADNGHHGKNNAAHAQYKAKKQVKAKKAYHSDRYYSTTVRNGKSVYILNDDVYRNARIIGYPRDGVVRVNVDNRTVEILKATRAILNVLN